MNFLECHTHINIFIFIILVECNEIRPNSYQWLFPMEDVHVSFLTKILS